MPEEVINENENENESGEGTGEESGSQSGSTTTGIDIASQSGQEHIADAIGNIFSNLHIYFHNTKVEESEANASTSEKLAESYAKGGTNSRVGEDTDNAKYYKEQAGLSATSASDDAILAESFTRGGTNSRTGEDTDNAQYYLQQISSYVTRDATTVTLLAQDWDPTTHLITVSVANVTADTNNEILPLLATSAANIANNNALRELDLQDAGQGNGTITLYAANIPSVDLSVRVIVHG